MYTFDMVFPATSTQDEVGYATILLGSEFVKAVLNIAYPRKNNDFCEAA